MSSSPDFDRLADLAPRYDAILCDVWGVIRGPRQLIPAALDALAHYREQGGIVVLLSNSPRRSASLVNYLYSMGADDTHFDAAVSSGEAIHAELVRRSPGPAFKLGPDWDDPLYEGTHMRFAPLEEAQFISCTGLYDYENETPDQYEALLNQARGRELEMVCANPDIVVQVGDKLLYCAGALAELYTALGGSVVMAGKPHPPIYRLGFETIDKLAGKPVERARVLAIGDGPATDIAGASGEGIDALFIADGIVSEQFSGGFNRDLAVSLLAEQELTAQFFAPKLVW